MRYSVFRDALILLIFRAYCVSCSVAVKNFFKIELPSSKSLLAFLTRSTRFAQHLQFFFIPAGIVIADVCFGVCIGSIFVAYPIKQTKIPTIARIPTLYTKRLSFIKSLSILKTSVQIHEHEALLNVF